MTRSVTVLGCVGALLFSACEPTFVDLTIEGAPTCPGKRLTNDIVVKLEGPRASSMFRLTGDVMPMTTKVVAGKLYKVKMYKCGSEPCEAPGNLFHGEDFTAPEGKTGSVTLSFPGAPACQTPEAPAAADAG